MELFDAQHNHHNKVSWPSDLEVLSIWLPSPIVQLLSHNNTPSLEETERVTSFRSDIERGITEHGEKIRELRQQIKLLKKEKNLLNKKAFVCGVVSSPFRRLPMEILQQIATHYEMPSPFCSGSLISPRSHFPLLLSQVSRSWRQALYGSSTFWKNLRLPLRSYVGVDKLEFYGRLSGRLPIAIQLQESGDFNGPINNTTILSWILSSWPGVSRLTKLAICSPKPSALIQYLNDQLYNSTSPVLYIDSLTLVDSKTPFFPIDTGCDGEFVTRICQAFPKLRRLWLDLHEVALDVEDLLKRSILSDTPWARLSTLYIGAPFQPQEWATFIKVCPNLEAASFCISGPCQSLPNPFLHLAPSPHLHRRLKELIIHFRKYSTHVLTPFAGIQFSGLVKLQINFDRCKLKTARVAGDLDLVFPFPSLRKLVILNTFSISKNIRGLLPLFLASPSVISLSISFSHKYVTEFLGFLRGTNAGAHPLPQLQTLKLWLSAETWYPDNFHEPWPKELDRNLALSLFETWETRHLGPNEVNTINEKGLKSMAVEIHTWAKWSEPDTVSHEGQAGSSNSWKGYRHAEWVNYQMAMEASFDYLQRKVVRKGSGIEVLILQGTVSSFGAPMEEKMKSRFEI
ncbi:hypothetical protein BJ165DRAFT_1491870 [Panaeolus papilionaceus]|nr:hypothetical protein BJ165DRAFT_1491870 [Panaeolus papilionaceus]